MARDEHSGDATRTEAERDEFVGLFKDLVTYSYTRVMESYAGEKSVTRASELCPVPGACGETPAIGALARPRHVRIPAVGDHLWPEVI